MSRAAGGADSHPAASAVALSLLAFMRVAGREFPGIALGAVDSARAQAKPNSRSSLLTPAQAVKQYAEEIGGTEAYGSAMHGNAWSAPRLLVREQAQQVQHAGRSTKTAAGLAAAQSGQHLQGPIVITGGMGALGTVAALWLASVGSRALWLLGRSGRTSGDGLPARLHRSSMEVWCAKCDVSVEEEAAFILQAAGSSSAAPLRGILHAGAVLDAKVISTITSRSVRTEFAGEGGGGGEGLCVWVGGGFRLPAGPFKFSPLIRPPSPPHPLPLLRYRQGVWRTAPAGPQRAQRPEYLPPLLLACRLCWSCWPSQLRCCERCARFVVAARAGQGAAGAQHSVGQLGR